MKGIPRFLLAVGLVLVLSSGVLAAGPPMFFHDDTASVSMGLIITAFSDIYTPQDHLFSTGEQSPRLEVQGLIGFNGPDMTMVNAAYTLNDFTYGTLSYLDDGNAFNIKGGYLWEDLGVFASLDYTSTPGPSGYLVAGGYRFDLSGGSYAALSLSYGGGDYGDSINGQAVVKYYADGLKLSGQLYVYDDGDYMIHGKANVAAGDNLVWGGGLTWYDDGDYMVFAGLTRTGEKSLFDAVVDLDDAGNVVYYLSYLYSISDALALGLNYMDGDMGDGLIALKGEYQLGDGALTFAYSTMVDSMDSGFICLGYEKSF